MPQRVRIADGSKTQSAEQLVTMAGPRHHRPHQQSRFSSSNCF